jgi:hypothetical protein
MLHKPQDKEFNRKMSQNREKVKQKIELFLKIRVRVRCKSEGGVQRALASDLFKQTYALMS